MLMHIYVKKAAPRIEGAVPSGKMKTALQCSPSGCLLVLCMERIVFTLMQRITSLDKSVAHEGTLSQLGNKPLHALYKRLYAISNEN